MKKTITAFLLLSVLASMQVCAQTVYDDNNVESPYYTQGQKYLENSQYSSAIIEFKKALRENPEDYSTIISLSNAYNARAAYYNNIAKDYTKAANDLRSAIFITKYFNTDKSGTIENSIAAMEANLKSILDGTNFSNSPDNIANTAKKLRTQGEFAASGYEWYKLLTDSKYKSDANMALGDIMNIFGKSQNSITFYETAKSLNSNNADLHIKLARVYEQAGNTDKATNEYNLALASSSETDDILNSLERIWQQKVMQNSKDAEAHANLGVIYQKQKNYSLALAEYKKAEELNPSNTNTRLNIGTLCQAQKDYNGAISAYNSILQLYPNNTKALLYKAQSLKALNQNQEAIKTYQSVIALEPNNQSAKSELYDILKTTMPTENVLAYLYQNVKEQPMNANSYYDFAYELHKANKIDDAIIYYNETLKLTSEIPDCYVNLSQAYRQVKNFDAAQKVIKQGLAKYPDNKLMKEQLALVQKETTSTLYQEAAKAYETSDWEKAIELYSKISPQTEDTLIGIASSYQSLGNQKMAIETFKKAIAIFPKNAELPYYIASIYYNQNDYANAKPYLSSSLSINPNNKDAKQLLDYINSIDSQSKLEKAFEMYSNGKNNEALAMLNEILKTDSNNSTALYYRGLIYDALGKYAQAITDYQASVKHSPEMSLAYYSIAVDYDNLAKFKEAKENYSKFISVTKDSNEYTDYAKKRIEEIK